jgi:uncharacterized protein YecT (DUF1311 family)
VSLNRLAAAALAFAVLQSLPLSALERRSTEIGKSARECARDPAYAPGGANVGDCLLDRAAKLEPRIAAALHRTSKRFCHAESRERLWQVQKLWTDYRRAFCSLIEELPGNTPAYVDAGACTLQATQQRLEALRSVGDTVSEWCLALSFEHEASRFGRPPAKTVKHSASGIAWRASRRGEKILVGKGSRMLVTLDATGCSYCDDKPDCSEGVFLFEYPSPAAGDPAFKDYALLHACRAVGGTQVKLVRDLLTKPETALQEAGLPSLDWHVDGHAITITASDGTMRTWTAPETPKN